MSLSFFVPEMGIEILPTLYGYQEPLSKIVYLKCLAQCSAGNKYWINITIYSIILKPSRLSLLKAIQRWNALTGKMIRDLGGCIRCFPDWWFPQVKTFVLNKTAVLRNSVFTAFFSGFWIKQQSSMVLLDIPLITWD